MNETIKDGGWVEVITGPMFSGKTEELLRRLRRATIAQQKVQLFKPAVDTRSETVRSHDAREMPVVLVEYAFDIERIVQGARFIDNDDVIGIDEAQFFAGQEALGDIVSVVAQLARSRRVVVAGLDLDSSGQPFGLMPQLMAQADYVTKLLAVCTGCGNPASRSQRITGSVPTGRVDIGGADKYEACCRHCFQPSGVSP